MQWKIHNTFHAHLLTPYVETEEYGEMHKKNPPDPIEGEEEYEVEAIIQHKGNTKPRRRFLVSWKGWPSSEDSWEPVEALENAQEVLKGYLARNRLGW